MKKALFVTHNELNKFHSGGSVCSARNLRLLSENYEVEVFEVKNTKIEKIISTIFLLFPPFSIISFFRIINKVKRSETDLVFLDTSLLGVLVKYISKNLKIKTIVFFHNVEIDYLDVRFGKSMNKLFYKFLCRHNETLSLKYSNTTICLNKRDQERLMTLYKSKPKHVIPITLESSLSLEEVINHHSEQNKSMNTLLFVGSLNRSNYISLKWFIENVMPILETDIKLIVVGKDFETKRDEFENDRIKIIGTAEDITEYYFNSLCVISPIFEGAGMKVKIAEALMFGSIIVGTDESLEGYVTNSKSIYRCNTAEEFSLSISKISKSTDHIQQNKASRLLFEQNYSDNCAINIFRKIADSI